MTRCWRYVNVNKGLIISGHNWDLEKVSHRLNVPLMGPCWPFLLAMCDDKNRMARCGKNSDAHASPTSRAHVLPALSNVSLADLAKECATPATDEQKRGLSYKPDLTLARGRYGRAASEQGHPRPKATSQKRSREDYETQLPQDARGQPLPSMTPPSQQQQQ